MESNVVRYQDTKAESVDVGVTRRILAYLPQQMVVEVCFEKGARGTVHAHPHTQCTYVLKGEFLFTIQGMERLVRAGDTLAFAPHEAHGCLCKEQGALIDVFAPMREDFIG